MAVSVRVHTYACGVQTRMRAWMTMNRAYLLFTHMRACGHTRVNDMFARAVAHML